MTDKGRRGPSRLAEMFRYLDALRLSGRTNMYGAGPYLRARFSLDNGESHEVLGKWMATFGDGSASVRERVGKAMEGTVK